MGAGYHGGFGKTNGDKTHQKNLETTKKSSNNLIDNEDCRDCVISVLDRIEESDEVGNELSINDLLLMLKKLKNNEEW